MLFSSSSPGLLTDIPDAVAPKGVAEWGKKEDVEKDCGVTNIFTPRKVRESLYICVGVIFWLSTAFLMGILHAQE